jgi:hypothetical protein
VRADSEVIAEALEVPVEVEDVDPRTLSGDGHS